jgi:hypothetical protein
MKPLTLLFLIINFASFAQLKLSGEWQGIIIENNQNWKEGNPIYMTISVINGLIDGKIREEIYNSNSFSVIKISGKTTTARSIELSEDRVLKQTVKVTNPSLRQLKFVYNEESGYFEGVFERKNTRKVGVQNRTHQCNVFRNGILTHREFHSHIEWFSRKSAINIDVRIK